MVVGIVIASASRFATCSSDRAHVTRHDVLALLLTVLGKF